MQWTPVQYVTRVIVEVARETGQRVLAVLREPFAATLWTWLELRQMAREASVERLGERVDLAGQIAVGFHEPKKLREQHGRYVREAHALSRLAVPQVKPETERERYQGMLKDLQTIGYRKPVEA